MTEIDKKTKINYLNIVIEDNEKYFDKLRKQADSDSQNDEEIKNVSLSCDGHLQETDEIYFEDGKLHYSGNFTSKEGSSYVCIEIPISQEVLFDILGDSIKKFNKIKTVLEATK
jgi:hypothetical protein